MFRNIVLLLSPGFMIVESWASPSAGAASEVRHLKLSQSGNYHEGIGNTYYERISVWQFRNSPGLQQFGTSRSVAYYDWKLFLEPTSSLQNVCCRVEIMAVATSTVRQVSTEWERKCRRKAEKPGISCSTVCRWKMRGRVSTKLKYRIVFSLWNVRAGLLPLSVRLTSMVRCYLLPVFCFKCLFSWDGPSQQSCGCPFVFSRGTFSWFPHQFIGLDCLTDSFKDQSTPAGEIRR